MAGILVDLTSDIKKLQELREEIAKVKKELTGINIKVDIDIKEGLEKQLQSLMSQYNNVAARISEVEGKMMILRNNVQKATEAQSSSSDITKIITDGLKSLEQASQSTSQSVENLAETFDGNKQKVEKNTQALEENAAATDKVRLSNAQLSAEISQIANTDYDRFIIKAKNGTLDYSNAINQASRDTARLTSIQSSLNERLQAEEISAEEYQRAMDEVQAAIKRTEAAYDSLRDTRNSSKGGSVEIDGLDKLDENVHILLLNLAELEVANAKTKQSLKDLNKEFKDGNITEEDYIRKKAVIQNSLDEESKAIQETKAQLKLQRQAVNEVEGSYNQLSAQYGLNKAILNKLSEEQLQDGEEYKKLLEETNAIYERMKAYQSSTGKNQLNVGNYESGFANIRAEQRALITELAQLTIQYREMAAAEKESAKGQELKQKIDELTEKAAELKDAMADVNKAVSTQSSDTAAFDSISEGINLVISGFGLAEGAAQLLGLSEEDLVSVQTKLQASFVAGNAVIQIQNTLQKESALIQGIYALQTKAAATAVTIKTAAEGKGVIVTKAATVAQAAFNAVAKANPYVLLAAALVSVVGALWAFTKGQEEAQKAEEKRKEALEKAKKEQEEYNEAIASGASKNISKLEELRRKWVDLGKDMDAQKKFIERNKDEFHSLGIEATNITDVENILINKTTEVKQAFMERAKAAAAAALATEKYQQALLKRQEKEEKVTYKKVKAGDESEQLKESNGFVYREVYDEKNAAEENKRRAKAAKEAAQRRNKEREDEAKALEEQANKLFDIGFESEKKANETLKKAGVKEYDKDEEQEKEKQKREAEKRKKEAAQLSKQQSEYTALLDKQKDETIKKQRDNSYEIWQNEIDLMEEGNRKTLAQIELDYDRQIAAIEDYEDKLKQEKIAAAKAAFEKNPANKGKVFDADSVDVRLTEQETELIQSMRDKTDKEYGESRQEVYKAELSAMRDYLKEYGTYQQQRLAIAEEYAEKIKKAQTEGERLSLTKERDKALRGSEDAQILNRVDWVTTFGKLGTTFDELIKNALAELNAYMQTDDFKNRPAEEKKAIIEAQGNLQSKVSNDATFEKLNKQIEAYRANVSVLSAAEAAHKAAIEASTAAEQERDKITDTGSKEYKEANDKVIAAKEEEERTASLVTTASDAVANAQANVARTATELQANLENFSAGLNQLTSGTLAGTVEGLEKLFSSLGMSDDIMNKFKKTLETGLSALFGDQLGGLLAGSLDLIEGFLTGDLSEAIISAVLGMIDNILDGVLSGDFITKPVTALVNGLGSIANTITFGGFNSWFGIGGNAKEVQETINKLTDRNETLQKAIENLTDEISSSSGVKAISASKQAIEYQQAYNENVLKKAQAQMGYHGDHHSWGSYFSGFSPELAEWITANVKSDYNNKNAEAELLKLTPEEMKKLLSNADIRDFITGTGKSYYGRSVLEFLDEYAEQAEKIQEITDALYENLTTTTKENVFDDFLNSLYDLADGADDVFDNIADNWQSMVNKMVINNLVGSRFQQKLEQWYEDLAKLNEARTNGEITDAEYKKRLEALQGEYEDYVKDAQNDIESFRKMGIIKATDSDKEEEQTATAKSIQNITQDQANEIDGRLNATQIAVEQGNELKRQQYEQTSILNAKFDEMMALKRQDTEFANNILDMMANSYLELQEIRDNTGSSAKSLKTMQSDLSDIKREIKNRL